MDCWDTSSFSSSIGVSDIKETPNRLHQLGRVLRDQIIPVATATGFGISLAKNGIKNPVTLALLGGVALATVASSYFSAGNVKKQKEDGFIQKINLME